MLYTISKSFRTGAQALLVAFTLVLFVFGCATTNKSVENASDSDLNGDRVINGISVSDESGTVKVKILGNSPLRYTSVKQAFPLGIVLYFPGTKLDNIDSEYPPEGDILNSIKTSQQSHSSGYDSRIKVLLNKDVDYDIIREENGLIVTLSNPEAGTEVSESALEGDVNQENMVDNNTTTNEGSDVMSEETVIAVEDGTAVTDGLATDSDMDSQSDNSSDIVEEPVGESYSASSDIEQVESVPVENEMASTPEIDSKPATQITSIDKKVDDTHTEISIESDGIIKDYKIFTIPGNDQKSARIVCDIFNLKGIQTKGEQSVPVNANGVQNIRYFNSPDKMRVVVDTTDANIKSYSAVSTGQGLVIHFGEVPTIISTEEPIDSQENNAVAISSLQAPLAGSEEISTEESTNVMAEEPAVAEDTSSNNSEEQQTIVDGPGVDETAEITSMNESQNSESMETDAGVSPYTDTDEISGDSENGENVNEAMMVESESSGDSSGGSWVNRIDFTSEKDGKSAIVIGTTKQVEYKITKKDDKAIHFRLYGTKIPKSRKYPFITTRFESAVNRIIPVQTPAMKDNSLFIIELREAVPYYVDQQGGTIKINFDASSVPPQPEDMAGLPMWKEVLSKTPEIQDIEMEASKAGNMEHVTGDEAAISDEEQPLAEEGVAPEQETSVYEGANVGLTSSDIAPDETHGAMMESAKTESGGEANIQENKEVAELDKPGMAEEGFKSMSGDGSYVSWAQKKKYTGEKISVDFFETDIKNVFRIIRSVSAENFAIDKDVSGKVTMTLDKPVPWDQVLDLVLKMNMLGMISEGGINRIATLETLKKEEETRLEYIAAEEKTKEKKKSLEPVITEYILVNYSNAEKEILPHIEKFLTAERGKVSVDTRTNQIILTDTKEKIKEAKDLIKKLDKITPQVIIEARIVEATTNFSRSFGTEWSLNSNPNYDVYNDTLGGTYGYAVAMNNTVASSSSIGVNFTRLTGAQFLLNAKLLAMESKGEGKIISAPKVLTMDNKGATITQGVEVPFSTVSADGTQTTFKKIELKLEVTPHVTSDSKISMKILIDKNDVGTITDLGPTITTKKVESELLIGDGDTIVIGGIIKSNKSVTDEGFPVISKIPVVGWLFKSRIRSEDKQELLIFLTPRIVSYEETAR